MRPVIFVVAAAVVATFPAVAADEQVGRLGKDVVPKAQSIVLDLDPRQEGYTGTVEIKLDVKKPVTSFRMHARQIDLDTIALDESPWTSAVKDDGMIELQGKAPLAPGAHLLRIAFHNKFDTAAKGLYRLKSAGEWYAFTQFEAVDARQAFPCFDEPSFKIPYSITITAPSDQISLANTPEAKTSEANGKRTTVFATTRPLPSYLVALAVGPFETVPIPGTSIPTRVICPKGSKALTAEAVTMTPPVLKELEKYFGRKYPYEKLDLIAVPEYWYGAMENPGLITFVDSSLLLDSKTANANERERLAVFLAHEIAHMWFGDLVTMAWWDDLWLNESFATWMEQKIVIQLYPEYDASIEQVNSKQGVMVTDTLVSTRAMRQPVQSVDSLLQSADFLAYSKGAAVLDMVESWIGADTFRTGVIAYLTAHADANATADDLWSALGAAAKKDVKGTLSSFLDQPGVPIVTAEIQGLSVKLTQTRFLSAGAKAPKPQLWSIPVSLRYPAGDGTRVQRVLLKEASQLVKLDASAPPAWVHPNADEGGYYRWSVAPDALAAMSSAATKSLTVRERVGLVGNVNALLSAGQLPGEVAVKTVVAFAGDDEPDVVIEVVKGIDTIRERFFSEHDDAAIAPFVRQTLGPQLEKIGPSPVKGERLSTTSLRALLYDRLADAGRDEKALAELEKLAKAYLADRTSVDPSLVRSAVMGAAIRGDAALFDTYKSRFESAKIPAERSLFLSALGNFRAPALVDRALAYSLTGPLRPQETTRIARTMGGVPTSRGAAWTWMTTHYDELAAKIPSDYMIYMPYYAAGCSEERVAAARTFFSDPKHAPSGTATELARVVESVDECVALDRRFGDTVRATTTH
ncbi:MAG TPA: M1 family metallopeptidase [Candidatus Polarisedimenticolaceae bacterium]|nr:M1 family metallopeptidase [Candidatus Polarisedimenticolaceae bacterium]